MYNLQKIENITALEVFTSDNAESLISKIEAEVRSFVPDLSTVKSRKEIASLSAKVSKSKVVLDGLGKNLVADWKNQAKAVDSERKLIRDRLDSLRDEVREPLTQWELEEKAKAEAQKLEEEIIEAHTQALLEDELFNRQKEIERKEEEQIQAELAAQAKAEAERIEAEKLEREKQIALEAKREAEQLAAKEKAESERQIIEAKAAVEMEKRLAKEAIERAKQEKIQAVKDAEDKAKREAEALEAKRLQDEQELKEEQARLKAIEAKAAANTKHQASINNSILKEFSAVGIDEEIAKGLIKKIAKKEIKYLSIQY